MSFEALARFPECVACGQGVDENDASTPYTIVKGGHLHLNCSATTEMSAAFAKEVHDYLSVGPNATRPHSKYRDSLLDEEETAEMLEAYLLGTPAIEFAKRLESRDIALFEALSDPYPQRIYPDVPMN